MTSRALSILVGTSAWLGASLLVTAVLAPAAFAVLPSRSLAATLVGRVLPVLFISGALLGLAILVAGQIRADRIAGGVLLAFCALAQLVITPRIRAIRQAVAAGIETLPIDDAQRVAFGRLHFASVASLGVAMLAALVTLGVIGRNALRNSRALATVVIATVIVGVLDACGNNATEPTPLTYGVITMTASPATGGYVTSPVAVFYKSTPLRFPSSEATHDTCAILSYSNNSAVTADTGLEFLGAGEAVTVDRGDSTFLLMPRLTGSRMLYDLGVTPAGPTKTVRFTPGSTFTFTIPGDPSGFPASSIAAKSAEAFSGGLSSSTLPAIGAESLVWSPAGDSKSKMVVSLRYATLGSVALNQQVYCSLVDDGFYVIPSSLLPGWRQSYNNNRESAMSRWRVTSAPAGNASLIVISTFDQAPVAYSAAVRSP